MSYTFEGTTAHPRTLRVAGLLAAIGLVAGLSACQSESSSDNSHEITNYTLNASGTTWLVSCDTNKIEKHQATAAAGDTLLSLAHKAGTELQQPINMGDMDIPASIFGEALAKFAGIQDPNTIYAGETYTLPASCEERPLR